MRPDNHFKYLLTSVTDIFFWGVLQRNYAWYESYTLAFILLLKPE
jgi:hypothetical protein